MKDNGTIKRIDRIIMRIDLNNVLGIMKRQSGILLRIDGILRAEYSVLAVEMKKSAKPQVKTYDLAFFYAFISWKIRREGKTFAK